MLLFARPVRIRLVLFLLLATLMGCGSKQEQTREGLKFFGMAYYNFHQIWKKHPANWDDMMTMAIDDADRELLNRVKDGGFLVAWSVDPSVITAGSSEFILALHPDTQANGGDVLFLDGSVATLTKVEIEEKLKVQRDLGIPQ